MGYREDEKEEREKKETEKKETEKKETEKKETEGKTEKKEHLPLFGVGPLYVLVLALLTLGAWWLGSWPALEGGRLWGLEKPLTLLGLACILGGVLLWVWAVVFSRIDDEILKGHLVTTGAYALVRNPIYSAFMIACTGVILIRGNAWLFFLPLVYWALMTLLMKRTEERWLRESFGEEYERYCQRVNRCWPWPGRRGKR